MPKQTIQNRKRQKIVVLVEKQPKQAGLAFVMHGLSGFKEQPHIKTFAEAFRDNGYTVVRFDTTNTFGESYGNYENATTTNYYEDLEDVISWAATQTWYQEPFCLTGHSLGGYCTARYAEQYPEKVKAIAPISAVISGALTVETGKLRPGLFEEWERTGWKVEPHVSRPGTFKRIKWSHMEDRMTHDLLPKVGTLTMPVLIIVGELDTSTLPEHQKLLYDKLSGSKEFHVIKNAPHTFRDPEQLSEIKKIMDAWIKRLK